MVIRQTLQTPPRSVDSRRTFQTTMATTLLLPTPFTVPVQITQTGPNFVTPRLFNLSSKLVVSLFILSLTKAVVVNRIFVPVVGTGVTLTTLGMVLGLRRRLVRILLMHWCGLNLEERVTVPATRPLRGLTRIAWVLMPRFQPPKLERGSMITLRCSSKMPIPLSNPHTNRRPNVQFVFMSL